MGRTELTVEQIRARSEYKIALQEAIASIRRGFSHDLLLEEILRLPNAQNANINLSKLRGWLRPPKRNPTPKHVGKTDLFRVPRTAVEHALLVEGLRPFASADALAKFVDKATNLEVWVPSKPNRSRSGKIAHLSDEPVYECEIRFAPSGAVLSVTLRVPAHTLAAAALKKVLFDYFNRRVEVVDTTVAMPGYLLRLADDKNYLDEWQPELLRKLREIAPESEVAIPATQPQEHDVEVVAAESGASPASPKSARDGVSPPAPIAASRV